MSSEKDFAFVAPGAVGINNDDPLTLKFTFRDAEVPLGAKDRIAIPVGERRKKIAVCGFASASRHRMPVTDPGWEIWSLNQLNRHIPRADRHFDIHYKWEEGNVPGTDHPRVLAQFPGPVYMVDPPESIPTGVRFPIEKMIAKFGDYYTSTVACMLALAINEIDELVEERVGTDALTPTALRGLYNEYCIGIFGIDLVVGTEYFYQKACVEYYIGQACGRGLTVYLPPETALCKQTHRYGWQEEQAGIVKLSELEARQAALVARKNGLVSTLQTVDGALQECDFVRQIVELRQRGATIPYPTETT